MFEKLAERRVNKKWRYGRIRMEQLVDWYLIMMSGVEISVNNGDANRASMGMLIVSALFSLYTEEQFVIPHTKITREFWCSRC